MYRVEGRDAREVRRVLTPELRTWFCEHDGRVRREASAGYATVFVRSADPTPDEICALSERLTEALRALGGWRGDAVAREKCLGGGEPSGSGATPGHNRLTATGSACSRWRDDKRALGHCDEAIDGRKSYCGDPAVVGRGLLHRGGVWS